MKSRELRMLWNVKITSNLRKNFES
uniref:Uncharacterized protein n=1 Tax=Arundo donax TaxID=35708 RepID=A0A0A8YZA2_ARUDO